ncbi:MAG: hypothetical protein K2O18_04815 [Oscillospiraceae bacterium]|nr:hypothetical protein [Oscillospiraceae bacterium]
MNVSAPGAITLHPLITAMKSERNYFVPVLLQRGRHFVRHVDRTAVVAALERNAVHPHRNAIKEVSEKFSVTSITKSERSCSLNDRYQIRVQILHSDFQMCILHF